MRPALLGAAIACAAVQLAHGGDTLSIEAEIRCYDKEFGRTLASIPAKSFGPSLHVPPRTGNSNEDQLFEGAFAGDPHVVDAALRKGASATMVVNARGLPAGEDSSIESAEIQYGRYQTRVESVPQNWRRPDAFSKVRSQALQPRMALVNGELGGPLDVSSVLMWAVLGAKRQWCLHEELGTSPWQGLPVIRRLVEAGANGAFEDAQGRSATALAISGLDNSSRSSAQREELARYLIESRKKGVSKATLTRWLILAADRGSLPLAQYLIASGADAHDDAALWRARVQGDDAMANLLLSHGAQLELSDRPEVRDRLEYALANGDMRALDIALANGGNAALAAAMKSGGSSRFIYGNVGNPSILHMLRDAGVRCPAPLSTIVPSGRAIPEETLNESAKILIEDLACDVNGRPVGAVMKVDDAYADVVRRIVRHGGVITSDPQRPYLDTLYWAAENNRPNLVAAVMEYNPPSAKRIAMVLGWAVDNASVEIVSAMVRNGADPNIRYRDHGVTLLMAAVKRGRKDVARVLVEGGANVNARTDAHSSCKQWSIHGDMCPDAHEFTALMFAARANDEETTMLLLRNGADRTLENDSGETAASLARGQLAQVIEGYSTR